MSVLPGRNGREISHGEFRFVDGTVTRSTCQAVGWFYRLVGAIDAVQAANLRWLAGYRHPRHSIPGLVGALRAAFVEPASLLAGAEAVGDPIAVLPVLFHLLWRQDLVADLSVPLHPSMTVTAAVAGEVMA